MAKSVVIVGGGSAGWMTASYLKKAAPTVNVTLIESATIKSVGVGEATFSTIQLFFDFLGLEEQRLDAALQRHLQACYQIRQLAAGRGLLLSPVPEVTRPSTATTWANGGSSSSGARALRLVLLHHSGLCDAQVLPAVLRRQSLRRQGPGAISERGYAERRTFWPTTRSSIPTPINSTPSCSPSSCGVRHVARRRAEFSTTWWTSSSAEDGSIDHIVTQEHGAIAGDLFVDCTGFRGLLINQALGEPFISFSESLLCDRAVAIQFPQRIAARGINPYTTATALNAGWVWNIPLYGRTARATSIRAPSTRRKRPRRSSASISARPRRPAGPRTSRCGSAATATPG